MATATSVTSVARAYDGVQGGRLHVLTAVVDLGSITTGSTEDITITLSGMTTSDKVLAVWPQTKDATLALLVLSGGVCTTDTITVTVGNPTAGSLNAGSVTLAILVLKASA